MPIEARALFVEMCDLSEAWLIQSMCVDTDDRITLMQSEIEDATSAKKTLEAEVQSIEAMAAHLLLELAEWEESLKAARKDLELS